MPVFCKKTHHPIYSEIKLLIACEGFWLSLFCSFVSIYFVLPVQLSIQTTESLQNKVGRKIQNKNHQRKEPNTPQQKKTNYQKNMKILDHNLKAYKALIKSFKKSNRAYQLIFLLLLFYCFVEWSVEKVK